MVAISLKTAYRCQCQRCKHEWTTRNHKPPRRCTNPGCRSMHWQESMTEQVSGRLRGWGRPGYVYVVQCGEFYKIGRTTNLERRIPQLTVQLPYPLKLVCFIQTPNSASEERRLHELYADKRLNGEWFALTDEQVKEIKAMTT